MTNKYDDARQPNDYDKLGVKYLTTFIGTNRHCIVNRQVAQRGLWEHLPRLAVELNNQEWEETPTEYKELYCWEGGKWLMRDAYRDCWGKEP